ITQSPLTHVGIVLEEHGQRMVWEAYGPVGPTPLAQWLDRTHGSIAVYRLDPRLKLHSAAIAAQVRAMRAPPHDGKYGGDDDPTSSPALTQKPVLRAPGTAPPPRRPFCWGATRP